MIRKLIEVEIPEEYSNSEIVNMLIKVEASGREFWEYYIGVDKQHPLFSKEEFLSDPDPRWKEMNTAFKGCKKSFDSYLQMANMKPIDGAWLSFASPGTRYDFLDDNLFYYGGGMYINPSNPNQNEKNCKRDALIMLGRMIDTALDSKYKEQLRIPETDISTIKAHFENMIPVPFFAVYRKIDDDDLPLTYYIKEITSLDNHTVSLYDRACNQNGKSYCLNGTDYIMNSLFEISKLKVSISDDYWYHPKTFETYKEALLFKCSCSSLNGEEIQFLKDNLKDQE